MSDRMMMTLTDIDKLDDTFTFRLPEVTKKHIEKLPTDLKKKLNIKLLLSVAEILHEADFDPRKYLSTKD